jgi:DNA-directed RNA polymerase subunit RPC12/RpoP
VAQLAWVESDKQPRVLPTAFWAMANYQILYSKAALGQNEADGVLDGHPDAASSDLLMKLGLSTFVQSWLPYLAEEDRDYLIGCAGLGEYTRAFDVNLCQRSCSQCATTLQVLQGNRSYPCPTCGRLSETVRTQPCVTCGAFVGVDGRPGLLTCPFCRSRTRIV